MYSVNYLGSLSGFETISLARKAYEKERVGQIVVAMATLIIGVVINYHF